MLEITLILILVVAAMVAIIVNRKSLIACIVITAVASMLGLGFLTLYANANKFASHEKLLAFTITSSVVVILILLAVTYIGVKMHFKKFIQSKKKYVPTPTAEVVGEPMLIPGTNVYAKGVGIFGRKPISDAKAPAIKTVVATASPIESKPIPQVTVAEAAPQVQEKPATAAPTQDMMLRRMLEKAENFKKAGQYVLAEQMYVTYIARCQDNSSRADGELLMLDCRILAGNVEGSKEQLADLLNKLRSGQYALTKEQKLSLADCKMNLIKLQQGE